MFKAAFRIIKKSVTALAGLLGGFIIGLLITVFIVHIEFHFNLELPSVLLIGLIVISLTSFMGLILPSFFMPYFLCPFSWILSDSDSSSSHFNGSDSDSYSGFFFQLFYFLGALFLLVGCFFSLPYIAIIGSIGIGIFTYGIHIENTKLNSEPSGGDH